MLTMEILGCIVEAEVAVVVVADADVTYDVAVDVDSWPSC
jgi:hypothetical protein